MDLQEPRSGKHLLVEVHLGPGEQEAYHFRLEGGVRSAITTLDKKALGVGA